MMTSHRFLNHDCYGGKTGVVINGDRRFVVGDGAGHSGPAVFISPARTARSLNGIPPSHPRSSTTGHLAIDTSTSGAVYKGLAIASTGTGGCLDATDFHPGTVDMFDRHFTPVNMPGAFTDLDLPEGYAPFGIWNLI